MKETLMALFSHQRKHAARAFYQDWHQWAMRSRLKPIKEVAKMLKRRLELILNYCRHRITNTRGEALNTKIQWVKATARGYRNQRLQCAILQLRIWVPEKRNREGSPPSRRQARLGREHPGQRSRPGLSDDAHGLDSVRAELRDSRGDFGCLRG